MAEHQAEQEIKAHIAEHLVASMNQVPLPGPAPLGLAKIPGEGQQWPAGDGKRRHAKERGNGHGRMGQGAAVTAIHRTSRPQMPHSS